jgi:hypothetical protein
LKSKRPYAALPAVLTLALAALACAGGAGAATKAPTAVAATPAARPTAAATDTEPAAATETQPATAEPTSASTDPATEAPTVAAAESTATQAPLSGKLDLHGISTYEDNSQYFRVVGLLTNGTDKPVNNVQLSLQLTDGSGKTVLQDDSGNPTSTVTLSPILSTIDTGETAPFEYFLSTNGLDTSSWQAKVAIDSSENPTDLQRVPVVVANNLLTVGSGGDVFLTGELVNMSDQPAQINNFAGALLDGSGNVAAASSFEEVARLLAPAGAASGSDRSPFVIRLSGPVKKDVTPNFYVDGVAGSSSDMETAADVHLKLNTSFVDANNDVHILATLSNSGTNTMTVRLVAGLYDQSGKVLDGSSNDSPLYLTPGASAPVPVYFFPVVDGNPDLINQVVSYTAQIDPYWTFPSSREFVALNASNVTTEASGSSLTIKGEVVNTSSKPLDRATVMIVIRGADGKLVTADWTTAAPDSGAIAPKAKQTWSVTTELPTKVDPATLKVETVVQGYIKQ